jgi:hypothetical protein
MNKSRWKHRKTCVSTWHTLTIEKVLNEKGQDEK